MFTQALPHIALAALGLPAVLLLAGGTVAAFMWSELRDGRAALEARRSRRLEAKRARRVRGLLTVQRMEREAMQALGTRRKARELTR